MNLVYCNLKLKCSSVAELKGSATKGKVLYHQQKVVVRDVDFVIKASEQRRARTTGQRNVHAYARGTVDTQVDPESIIGDPRARRISYNVFKADTFFWKDTGEPVESVPVVAIDGKYAYAIPGGEHATV